MKRILWAILALVTSANAAYSQTCWTIGTDGSIELNPERIVLPYSDHIEMSGEQVSCVLRWMVDEKGLFGQERSLVFPMLRRVPNDTHASLLYRMVRTSCRWSGSTPLSLGSFPLRKCP